jgi:hypothetical protein
VGRDDIYEEPRPAAERLVSKVHDEASEPSQAKPENPNFRVFPQTARAVDQELAKRAIAPLGDPGETGLAA